MKKCFYLCLLLLTLSGCRIMGYKTHFERDLTEEEKSLVVWTKRADSLNDIKNDGKIYAITAAQLSNLLAKHHKAVVYQWSSHCTSSSCVSLSAMQYFCTTRDIALFVVADFFADSFSQNVELADYPLFIANEREYGTSKCNKISKLFYVELIGEQKYNELKDVIWYRYMYFEDGKFSGIYKDIYNELK